MLYAPILGWICLSHQLILTITSLEDSGEQQSRGITRLYPPCLAACKQGIKALLRGCCRTSGFSIVPMYPFVLLFFPLRTPMVWQSEEQWDIAYALV